MTAYDKGVNDFHQGVLNNPYPAGTPEHQEYVAGHGAAEKDFLALVG